MRAQVKSVLKEVCISFTSVKVAISQLNNTVLLVKVLLCIYFVE